MSNELKTLDLRFKGKLTPKINNLFNEIAIKEKNSSNTFDLKNYVLVTL